MEFKTLNPKQQRELTSHFCKLTNLPYDYINDELLNIICKEENMSYIGIEYEDFISMLEDFKTPTEYFNYINDVISKAKKHIVEHHIFEYFKKDAIELFQNGIEDFKKEHFKEEKRIGDKIPFLYVTLPTPIFASLSFYSSSELFLGAERYSSFIKQYTPYTPLQRSIWVYEKIFNFDNLANEKIKTYNEHIFIDTIYPALEKYFLIPNFISNNLVSIDKNGILIALDGFEAFDDKDQRDLELCYNITQTLSKRLRELLGLSINCELYSIQNSQVDWIDFKIKKNYNIYRYIPDLNSNIYKYICDYDYEYLNNERKR